MSGTATAPALRPRVEGEREVEVYEGTLGLLAKVGYDKLTLDAVATLVKASKATLYRRWAGKRELVLEALTSVLACPAQRTVSTGTLRGDLLAASCEEGTLTDDLAVGVFCALVPAMQRDPELRAGIREQFVEPKSAISRATFAAARERGEVRADADLDTLASILPALCLHEAMLTGAMPTRSRITTLIDTVVLPASRPTAT